MDLEVVRASVLHTLPDDSVVVDASIACFLGSYGIIYMRQLKGICYVLE